MGKRTIQRAPYGDVVDTQEINGIEMGVFQDGTAFLGARGLAAMCGVAASTIIEWAQQHDPASGRVRDSKIGDLIKLSGYPHAEIFFPVTYKGKFTHAFPDPVCVAVLTYYAREGWEVAQTNLARLAGHSLRDVVYRALGYDEQRRTFERFRPYHDRLLLNNQPGGFFSVFTESASMILSAIQAGLVVDQHTVPDISVGRKWSDYWIANPKLAADFGERVRYQHTFPDYFPQSRAIVEPWVYPLRALGEFKTWLESEYIPKHFPKYLNTKAQAKAIAPASVIKLLAAMKRAKKRGA